MVSMDTLPMLALGIDKARDLEFPAWIQPKLDGHRAVVVKRNGKCAMHSRTGHPIETMGHILEYLEPLMGDGEALDGELYCHGMSLRQITSLVSKQQPDSELIQFHCFDMMSQVPFSLRIRCLPKLHETGFPAVSVPRWKVKSEAAAMIRAERLIKAGYEGAILRLPDWRYQNAMRSDRVLKIKAKHLAALVP